MAGGGVRSPCCKGRGGSVSRRDHNQSAGNLTHLAGGTNSKEKHNSTANCSSGERGLGGEGLLSEKPPLPPAFPRSTVFPGGSAREGAFLQKGPLPRISHSFYF